MGRVAPLVARKGRLSITLRHGPVPPGRCMFEVSGAEATAQAEAQGLTLRLNRREESIGQSNRAHGVVWTGLLFERV